MTSKWYVKPLRGEYASVAGVGDKYPGREVRTQQEENKASVGDWEGKRMNVTSR